MALCKLSKDIINISESVVTSTCHIPGSLLAEDQPRMTYSILVGTVSSGPKSRGAVSKKAYASKLRNNTVGRNNNMSDDFKVNKVILLHGNLSNEMPRFWQGSTEGNFQTIII